MIGVLLEYSVVLCVLHRFLTGPANLKDPEAKFRFPKIFVSAEDGYEELHLIVYKVRSASPFTSKYRGSLLVFIILKIKDLFVNRRFRWKESTALSNDMDDWD